MASLDEVKKWVEEDTQPKKSSFLRSRFATPPIRSEHQKAPKVPTKEDIQNTLDAIALGSSPAPFPIPDVLGLGADLYRYATDKESRNALNYLLTGAGLLPFVPSGAGIITRAKSGGNVDKFVEELELAGFNRDEIWEKAYQEFGYGAYRGKDKIVRVEIPDTGAKIKMPRDASRGSVEVPRPEQILEHMELYKIIPELKSADIPTKITVDPTVSPGYGFGQLTEGNKINITAGKTEDAQKILLHELNHFIQDRTGLAGGGSPEGVAEILNTDMIGEKAFEVAQKLENSIHKLTTNAGPASAESYAYWGNLGHHALYRNLLGEVESRAVERRMKYLPEELRKIPFYKDYDVGEDFIITDILQ